MNWNQPDWLLGRRYVADFRVQEISERKSDGDRIVTLTMYGDTYTLGLSELRTVIERGFVVEAGGE